MRPSKTIAPSAVMLAALAPWAPPPGAQEAVEPVGEWRYNVSCASCHGLNGEGIYAFGIALRDNPFVLNAPTEAVVAVVQEGRYNRARAYREYPGMPGFDYIRGDEAEALVEYMKDGLQQ